MEKKSYLGISIKFFLQGILIIGSLSATVWTIWSIFKSVDNSVPNTSHQYPGAVFAAVLFGTVFIGFVGSKPTLGQLFVGLMDYTVVRIPGVKIIYSSIKDMLTPLIGDKRRFTNPVWVRVNKTPETRCIGLLTQYTMNFTNLEGMVSVHLPYPYAMSGWVIATSVGSIKPAEGSTAQKAMEFALSGGILKNDR